MKSSHHVSPVLTTNMSTLILFKNIKVLTILISSALLVSPCYALSETTIRLIHNDKIAHSVFAKLVGINQTTLLWPIDRCPKLFSDETKGVLRVNIELVIICNALKRANFQGNIQIVPSGNNQRQNIELANGNADLVGHSIFRESLSQAKKPTLSSFFITDPVIKQGQFFLGIFTSANQLEKVSQALKENKLNSLIATTVSSWKIDVKTLQSMTINSLHLLPMRKLLLPNLERKRANFTLAALDARKAPEKRLLKRIDGYKVSLAGDRVFIVNKSKPRLFKAIQDYILYLREQDDLLTKTFEHANFITDKYQSWKQIN